MTELCPRASQGMQTLEQPHPIIMCDANSGCPPKIRHESLVDYMFLELPYSTGVLAVAHENDYAVVKALLSSQVSFSIYLISSPSAIRNFDPPMSLSLGL